MTLTLSLIRVSPTEFTTETLSDVIDLGLSLVDTLPGRPPTQATKATTPTLTPTSWSVVKEDPDTKLWKGNISGEPWVARVHTVNDITYDALRTALTVEKNVLELVAFLKPHDSIDVVANHVFGDILVQDVHKLLHVQAFSAREFTESIIVKDLPPVNSRRRCIIVSLPRVAEVRDSANVAGVYVSVETVMELEDGAGVEVVMAVCSDAAGSIPRWVQNIAINNQVYVDGKAFLEYMRR